jgi:ankyrin repeat protein
MTLLAMTLVGWLSSSVLATSQAPTLTKEPMMSEQQIEQLLAAVRAGDRTCVEQLLSGDSALARATAPTGASAVLWAAYTGHPELAPIFAAHGARFDLWEAAALGDVARVQEIVGAAPHRVNSVAPDGFFALGLAAFFGHADVVAWLLDHGADINQAASNPPRVTALHGAVARRNVSLAAFLLKRGANPNVQQATGLAPLHEAAANGDVELVRLLVANGARVDAKTEAGKTPADFASDRGHPDLAKWLRQQA